MHVLALQDDNLYGYGYYDNTANLAGYYDNTANLAGYCMRFS